MGFHRPRLFLATDCETTATLADLPYRDYRTRRPLKSLIPMALKIIGTRAGLAYVEVGTGASRLRNRVAVDESGIDGSRLYSHGVTPGRLELIDR